MSTEHAIAQYERETDPPPVKRPWAVMWTWNSLRSGWVPWRVFGTYTTRERAERAAARITNSDARTHIVGPGEPRVGPSP